MKSIRLNLTIAAIILLQVVSMNAMRRVAGPIAGQRAVATAATVGVPSLMHHMRHQAHTVRSDYGEMPKVNWQQATANQQAAAEQPTYWQQFKQSNKNYWQKQSQTAKDAWSDAKARTRQGWQNTGRKIVGGGVLGAGGMYYLQHDPSRTVARKEYELQEATKRGNRKSDHLAIIQKEEFDRIKKDIDQLKDGSKDATKYEGKLTKIIDSIKSTLLLQHNPEKLDKLLEAIITQEANLQEQYANNKKIIAKKAFWQTKTDDYKKAENFNKAFNPEAVEKTHKKLINELLKYDGVNKLKVVQSLIQHNKVEHAKEVLEKTDRQPSSLHEDIKILAHKIAQLKERIKAEQNPYVFKEDFKAQNALNQELLTHHAELYEKEKSLQALKKALHKAVSKKDFDLTVKLAEKGAPLTKEDIADVASSKEEQAKLQGIMDYQQTSIAGFRSLHKATLDEIENPRQWNFVDPGAND